LTKKVTAGVIIVSIVALAGYDIFIVLESSPGDTLSEILRDWAWKHPSLAFAFGGLCGHWFGNFDRLVKLRAKLEYSWALLGLIAVGWALVDFFNLFHVHPFIALLTGVPAGAILWAQEPKEELAQ
jgi:hypothetical protein